MPFIPRLSTESPTPMQGSQWWYSNDNIYYAAQAGIGLPNCTCYAYGRAAEILNSFTPITGKLPMQDGGMWYAYTTGLRKVPAPNCVPELGCIMCFQGGSQGGHVAVVEQINRDSNNNIVSVVTSNSAYNRPDLYFYLDTLYANQNYGWGNYTLVGIIYLDGAGIQISDYVISAIAGVWNIESGLNPSVWEAFKNPTYTQYGGIIPPWSVMYGYAGDNSGGYGMSGWTNTDGYMLLEMMVNWCRSNGYYVNDSQGFVEPTGQLAYFLYRTDNWAWNSPYLVYHYSDLSEFLSSTETNIDNLTAEFLSGWESGGQMPPQSIGLTERQYSAQICYRYIQNNKNRNPDDFHWHGVYNNGIPDADVNTDFHIIPSSPNDELSQKTYDNLMCMYFYLLQGYSPTPPTPPPPTHKKMPLWMMLRRLYR